MLRRRQVQGDPMSASAPSAASMRGFRYYDLLVGGMVAVLLCSNLIGPAKVCTVTLPLLGALTFGAGNLFFPISYIFGDVLTEVYGYARARRAIWAGFGAMLFATFMTQVILRMPASPSEPFNAQLQPALEVVFGGTWRIALASLVAYWIGDFANSFVMAKMKLLTRGRMLWTRTIGSTLVGQGVDSLTFYPIAFIGIWEGQTIPRDRLQLADEGDGGGGVHAADLRRGGFPQASGGRGHLRRRYALQSLQPAG
jgi:uncharacterized integral membrane protein (TIGR00697 family)